MHHVPLDLLLAVAATESNWDPGARSHANAHGLMQIQWPGTARHLGVRRVSELYNPCLNIELGARYLRELLDTNEGDVERALASYNYGPTRIARAPELPRGAQAYVATVRKHQGRINAAERAPATEHLAQGGMQFANGLRARRFARSLQARINGAQVITARQPDGTYLVRLEIGPGGLGLADRRVLRQVGWVDGGLGG